MRDLVMPLPFAGRGVEADVSKQDVTRTFYAVEVVAGRADGQVKESTVGVERHGSPHICVAHALPPVQFTPDDAAAIHQALDRLDAKHRDILLLFFIEDFSLTEIFRILNCPEGTVKSRLHYAKNALKGAISGDTNANSQ